MAKTFMGEIQEDIDIISKAREIEQKKPRNVKDKRIPGLKIAMWIGFGYVMYSAYSYTPLKDELNRVFDSNIF